MNNLQIADKLEMVADLLEFQGANAFRTRAYRNGSRAIRDLPQSLQSIVEAGEPPLTSLEGIGKSVAEKCQQLLETGKLPQLNELLDQVPKTVLDLLRIEGLGPKKAALLYNELGIATLDQLEAACEAGKVRELKGFGAKTEKKILQNIPLARTAEQRMYWMKADLIAAELREHLTTCNSIAQLELAGSYRRGKETVGDLDVLVVSEAVDEVMDCLGEFPNIAAVLGRGDTKMSIRLESNLQIDLRVVPEQSFGAALQYFTGSKEHNVVVRGRAKQMGLKVNEWGVFRTSSASTDAESSDDVYVSGRTEEEVYAALDLPWFPPESRENRFEFSAAEQGALPALIEVDDIVGDLHMHTHATDGKASIEEMVAAAKSRGLQYIAITDHSQRVSMARGLDVERLIAQWKVIDDLNAAAEDDFLILKGIECDILEAGGMDLPDEVLAQADWVLASVHYGQKQPRQQITDRLVGAIENRHVDAIAHPTGRLINKREPYEADMDAVFQAAKEYGKILELNANPARLDLNDVHCAAAKKLGIPIVINTDAHSTDGLSVMRYGILQARRGGLTKADVVNTRPWQDIVSQ